MSETGQEAIAKYREISRQLANARTLTELKTRFNRAFTLQELLDWLHAKLQWSKGPISRHVDPLTILEYGKGRCGEYSILYTALCLAHGYRARIVLDMTDHVWTEVYDEAENKWIHIDPSERRIDDPRMYERDWKKNLTRIYAFENGEQEDVTENYKLKP